MVKVRLCEAGLSLDWMFVDLEMPGVPQVGLLMNFTYDSKLMPGILGGDGFRLRVTEVLWYSEIPDIYLAEGEIDDPPFERDEKLAKAAMASAGWRFGEYYHEPFKKSQLFVPVWQKEKYHVVPTDQAEERRPVRGPGRRPDPGVDRGVRAERGW